MEPVVRLGPSGMWNAGVRVGNSVRQVTDTEYGTSYVAGFGSRKSAERAAKKLLEKLKKNDALRRAATDWMPVK